ncbi:MAG: MFS transporter [Erysipelotrichaceae bacterium]|nr:MFS transporter [Erysipelotrichaceae bacterium]
MKTEGFLRYGMMDGLFYAWCASFTGFITSYFLACGLSASKLSTMLAVYMITCFAGALFWGGVCDKLKTNRKVFIASFTAVILIAGIITVITPHNVNLAIVLYPVMGFMLSSLGSNLDAWMLRSFHKDGTLYGKARAIGSLGYSVTALAAGMIINTFGYSMIQPLQIVTGVLTLLMAFFLKELPFEETAQKKTAKGSPRLLLRSPLYVILIVLLFLGGLAVSPVNNMKTVFIQNVGGDVSMLGLDSFIGVTLQAVLIFVSGRFTRIPVKVRLLIMSSALLADMMLIYFAVSPFMIILGSIFWNISFSVMLPTQREIVEKHIDPSVRNIAHNVADAAYNNFSAIIALSYSGILIDQFGVRMIAFAGILIMLTAVAIETSMLVKKENSKNNVYTGNTIMVSGQEG